MVTLEVIRADMEKQLAVDKEIRSVEVYAESLDECLNDASVQLETKKSDLEYEIIERGNDGFVGLMKKPWKIKVYENPTLVRKKKEKQAAEFGFEGGQEVAEKAVKKDGMFYVHRFDDKICVKIVLPVGEGTPVSPDELLSEARRPDNTKLDEDLLKKIATEGTDDKYVAVGTYIHKAGGDASFGVDISKDDMQATITVTPPDSGGADLSAEKIISALSTQGVLAGIEEDKIAEFVDNPVYNIPYEVAAAVLPVNGADAYIEYKFDTDKTKLKLKETASGQIDFKELNLIQNVVEGQPLAIKHLAERGKGGKNLKGRYLEAKNGKDIPVPLGLNTKLDVDGVTIVAEKNGHVTLVGDKITVEEVYEVQGVNIKTGNVTYMGTVVCRGNVDDGFNIKADGNIEIYGSVGKCKIEAGGDIVISQGVMGRDEGEIISNKSVWARFLQNVKVTAEEFVVVNDNIMNCNVTAMKKIMLKGKRASIIGGHLFATEEITAKNIGSAGGGLETILEVGFDPKLKMRLLELQEMQADVVKQLEEIDLNISTLENQQKVRRSLPKEKEESLANLKNQKMDLMDSSEKMTAEINEINARYRELKVVGRVNASGTVYPGVKILVRDETDEVRSECKSVTFYYDNGFVKRGKYDPSQATQDIGVPSGYTAN